MVSFASRCARRCTACNDTAAIVSETSAPAGRCTGFGATRESRVPEEKGIGTRDGSSDCGNSVGGERNSDCSVMRDSA